MCARPGFKMSTGTIDILVHLTTDWQMNHSLNRIFPFALALSLAAQASASITLVKADRLLDARSGNMLSPAAVLIEDGKIKGVGSPSQLQDHAAANTSTIDLGNATLLPGLI